MLCENCSRQYCDDRGNPKIIYCTAYTKKTMQTNADRIRAMSDDELANWIDWLFGRCEWCDTDKMTTDDCNDVECTSCILEWLKQPAEGE